MAFVHIAAVDGTVVAVPRSAVNGTLRAYWHGIVWQSEFTAQVLLQIAGAFIVR